MVAPTAPASAAEDSSAPEPAPAPDPAPPAAGGTLVTVLLVLAFLLVMVFLVAITMDGDRRLPDLTQASSAVVTALLGGVINPGSVPRRVWLGLAVLSLAVAALAGAYVFAYPTHTNSVAAVTAAIAAFVGLLTDTTSLTHLGPRPR